MGAQHLRIPRGLLRALCYPGGIRLPKLVGPPPNEETTAMAAFVHAAPTIIRPSRVVAIAPVKPEMGNLSNEAYRFFMGDRVQGSTFFKCRGCLEEEMDFALKVPHVKKCRALMQNIVNMLQRDNLCVICNHHTQQSCWTVPICSEACRNKWRFEIPASWMQARNILMRSWQG